jgi:hypothetical protein
MDAKSPSHDRTWKVAPIVDHVMRVSKLMYNMKKEVSLDEQMVKCRGHIRFRHRNPSKPIRDGIKVYAICCPETGCVWNYITYNDCCCCCS